MASIKLLSCEGQKEMLQTVLRMEQKVMIKIISLIWNWWKTRNKINAGEGKLNVEVVTHSYCRKLCGGI